MATNDPTDADRSRPGIPKAADTRAVATNEPTDDTTITPMIVFRSSGRPPPTSHRAAAAGPPPPYFVRLEHLHHPLGATPTTPPSPNHQRGATTVIAHPTKHPHSPFLPNPNDPGPNRTTTSSPPSR